MDGSTDRCALDGWLIRRLTRVVMSSVVLTMASGTFCPDATAQRRTPWIEVAPIGAASGSAGFDATINAPAVFGVQDRTTPSFGRYALQSLLGLAGSWLVGGVVHWQVDEHADDREVIGDAGYSRTANWSLLGASAVGAGVGTWLGGRLHPQSSLAGNLLGSAVATVPFALGVGDPYLPYYMLTLGTGLQILGGVIGGDLHL